MVPSEGAVRRIMRERIIRSELNPGCERSSQIVLDEI